MQQYTEMKTLVTSIPVGVTNPNLVFRHNLLFVNVLTIWSGCIYL